MSREQEASWSSGILSLLLALDKENNVRILIKEVDVYKQTKPNC